MVIDSSGLPGSARLGAAMVVEAAVALDLVAVDTQVSAVGASVDLARQLDSVRSLEVLAERDLGCARVVRLFVYDSCA